MGIPHYQDIMLPLLKIFPDQQEHSLRQAIEILAGNYKLSDDERKELLSSGNAFVFDNRVGWAILYLKKAGLLVSTRRGFYRITQRGLEILEQNPTQINNRFLKRYPEFVAFIRGPSIKDKEKTQSADTETTSQQTPEESLEYAHQKIKQDLAQELLSQVKSCSSNFFERLVVELLVKMGYGGSRIDVGKAVGKSGDGGIDGTIKEDLLGLDAIYIQAKRWEGTVGRPEIQKFVGALQGKQAKKGVFITTSNFSNEAIDYVSRIDSKIVLIDGGQLTQLMIDHDVEVSKVSSYEIKKIDSDYFMDE